MKATLGGDTHKLPASYLADWAGLSRGGIRFLEEKGIISGQREEESGYRFFDDDDFVRVALFQRYRAAGFPWKEAASLCSETPESVLTALEERQKELDRDYRKTLSAIERAREATLIALENEEVDVRMSPSFLVHPIPSAIEDEINDTEFSCKYEELASNDVKWQREANAPEFGVLFRNEEHENLRVSLTHAETGEQKGLASENSTAFLLPSRRCARFITTIPTSNVATYDLTKNESFTKAQNLGATAKNALGRVGFIRREANGIVAWVEVWAAIEDDGDRR